MSRGWLVPLAPLYSAGLAAKNAAYDSGRIGAKRLRWPVVSVGNLSVGGAGKTPLTIRLAELLVADGFAVDVLSRGYGRRSTVVERVDPKGDATRFGDEPLLIARRTGVPVYVGASRFAAGLLAEGPSTSVGMTNRGPSTSVGMTNLSVGMTSFPARPIHLLDDGFQHRQLARDLDVVVLHRSDFSERLLPAGRLREPLTALLRADVVVIREEDAGLEAEVRRLGVEAPVWWMRRSLAVEPELVETTERVVGFCGIARPEEFSDSLIVLGVNLEMTVNFPDHHRYTRDDMERLAKTAREVGAEAFVVTEKDRVKLDSGLLGILERVAPVRVARLMVSLRDEASVVGQIRAKLAAS